MALISLPSHRSFEQHEGESILAAAARAGLTLPHSCRTGRCSTCKAKVLQGDSAALSDETGLQPSEREAGWVLTCVRSARGDLLLDVEDLGDLVLAPARMQPCRIQSIDRVAPDVLRVTLRLPPTVRLGHLAGQYIDLIGPGGVRRSYSVANAPRVDGTVELHVREVPGGAFSAWWFAQAKPNDLLRLNGPLGTCVLRDIAGRHLVMLATGTGLAPIKAMLESLALLSATERPASTRVYWGARHEVDLYWTPSPELSGLDLQFTPVLSRANVAWVGARGYIQDVFLRDREAEVGALPWNDTRVFACGSQAMIQSAQAALMTAGLAPRHFHADAFVPSAPV